MRRAALMLAVLVGLLPDAAMAESLQPVSWPDGVAVGGAPNAIRYGGIDRYHTSRATALALHAGGGLPFDSPDPAGAPWGAATCPSSIIVVAGDTPADALAAAPLSDPTNRSDEPRLERVAARDPVFDPIGGVDRVDTFAAPIIVTTSTRSGATSLAVPAREAAADLVLGGCTTAREAVIVGGTGAVPSRVEDELLFLGYEEVFRVAGRDRFETAARVAASLGTEPAPEDRDCSGVDGNGTLPMGFHGNGVIAYRPSATECTLFGNTVVLADGVVGADALAAGWWVSYWQLPILLVDGDGLLPPPTRAALRELDIDTIVVLGGTGRIPESTVDEARELATAVAGRFGGIDRFQTSTITAAVFGGWYPTGESGAFAGDRLCLAASGGATAGWPDALGAGPWCARLTATGRPAPSRVLEPVEAADAPLPSAPPSHAAAPVILVPNAAGLTSSVRTFLHAAFGDGDWCRGGTAGTCDAPGFAIAFGGVGAIPAVVLGEVSGLLAGDDPAQRVAAASLHDPFATRLDLSPVYIGDFSGTARTCFERASIRGARWLARYTAPDRLSLASALDLVFDGGYESGSSRPRCVASGGDDEVLAGVAASGDVSASLPLGEPVDVLAMSAEMGHASPSESDGVSGTSTDAGITTWRFRDAPPGSINVTWRGGRFRLREASVTVTIERRRGAPDRFFADVQLEGGSEPIGGSATGEAALVGADWHLSGRFRLSSGGGGFRATLSTNATADNADDGLKWQIDVVSAG